jgi:hypothetical protein
VKKNHLALFAFLFLLTNAAFAAETSFHGVKVPDAKGRQIKAVLTFSDTNKAVQVQPVKGKSVSIPYAQIDKCSYEFTKKHRINEETIATAPIGVGAVLMFTESKSHWLEIDYLDQAMRKAYVVRMR